MVLGAVCLAGQPAPQAGAGQGPSQDDERSRSVPDRPLDSALLRAVYMDLLGRSPAQAERETWSGRQFADLTGALIRGREFWEHWIQEQLYYFLLIDNFRPQADRVVEIPELLQEDRIGVRDAIHRIALCASFDQRNPGSDTFVTVVMEQLLSIKVQSRERELEMGKRLYDGGSGVFLGTRGASQSDVVRIAISDRRFLSELLAREYTRLLRTKPPRRDLSAWTRRLEQQPQAFGDLLHEWLMSEAYDRRLEEKVTQPNRLFVRAMYMDLLDRLPGMDEQRSMRDALDGLSDPGPLRSVLARLLLDSGGTLTPEREDIEDATTWIRGLFDRLLGRPPTEEELKVFVTAYHQPDCRPTTVVYAIVSHPEYHSF